MKESIIYREDKLRNLSPFEKVAVLTNKDFPVNIVAILDLLNGPPPEILRKAILLLEYRHPLLNVTISESNRLHKLIRI